MLKDILNSFTGKVLDYIDNKLPKKHWELKIGILAALVSLFFAFPYIHGYLHSGSAANWNALITQFDAPFKFVEYAAGTHPSNIGFRVTVPLLAHYIGFGRTGSFVVQYLSFFILFYLVASLSKSALKDRTSAAIATFAFAFIWAGNILCSDIRGFFDVVSFALIVGAMRSKNPFIIFACLLLASFNDERSLIASGFVFLWHLMNSQSNGFAHFKDFFRITPIWMSIIGSWVAYFILRFLMVNAFDFQIGAADIGVKQFLYQFNNLPLGTWLGLEGFWLIIFFTFIILWKSKAWTWLIANCILLLLIIILATAVVDITRSMAYMFPIIFISMLLLQKSAEQQLVRKILLVTFIMCLFPAYYAGGSNLIYFQYPFPIQLLRGWYIYGA